MNGGSIGKLAIALDPAWRRAFVLLMLTLVLGLENTAFAGQSAVRLDDIQLDVQVGASEEVSTPDGVTFRTSLRIDEVVPAGRMFIFIWHVSNHQGFAPNTHTVQSLTVFDPHAAGSFAGEVDSAADNDGGIVVSASNTTSDELIPGLTYFARAHVVAVNESDFDQEAQAFRVSYPSEYSQEVSFSLPSPLSLRSDLRYFLIDRYYSDSDDEYALVEEGDKEVLYLQVRHDAKPRSFGDGDLFAELALATATARPLPAVGDVVIFERHLYDVRFMKNPLEIIAIDDAGHMLLMTVKRLPRHEVIEGDVDLRLQVDTATGHAEISVRTSPPGRHDEEGAPAGRKAGESPVDDRFIAHDDGTVLDTLTNLMWAATDNGSPINWADAKSYCESYRGGGHTDWRMPSQEELATLYDERRSQHQECYPAIGLHVATDLIRLSCCCPWASETLESRMYGAGFNFENGATLMGPQSSKNIKRALPVRFAQ